MVSADKGKKEATQSPYCFLPPHVNKVPRDKLKCELLDSDQMKRSVDDDADDVTAKIETCFPELKKAFSQRLKVVTFSMCNTNH